MVDFGGLVHQMTTATLLISFILSLQVSFTAQEPNTEGDLDELALIEEVLENAYPDEDVIPTDKRYARLSFGGGGGSRRGNNRYYNSRYYRSRYYQNYKTPWKNLPDTICSRQKCKSDRDCCRRYSKCDKSAKVCYACWYGHPCKSSRDCCERYPYCNRMTETCQA